MLYRWHIGWRRGGGIGLRHVPIYYMPYWRIARTAADRVEYRPSEYTLIHLLGISGMAALLLALMLCFFGFPWSPGARVQSAERMFHWAAFAGLSAIAVLPLAGYPLQKVTIERSPEGELIIRKRGLWPSTRRFPGGTFRRIVCGAEEEVMRRRAQRVTLGWMWMVKLRAAPQATLDRPPSIVDDPEVVFYIDHQKHQPQSGTRPRSVRRMVKHLQRLTGIAAVGEFEVQIEDRGLFRRPRRAIKESWHDTAVTEQVFSASDELPDHVRTLIETGATSGDALAGLPDHLRETIEAQTAAGNPPETSIRRSVRLTVRDADGNERTYTSLEEMPPEVRAKFEQALRSARRTKKRES